MDRLLITLPKQKICPLMGHGVFIFCFLFFSSRSQVWGGGYEFLGAGTRASTMGGAFIGKADDDTASYWNPAGLAQLPGKSISFNFQNDNIYYYDNNSVRNIGIEETPTLRNDVFIRHLSSEPNRFNEPKPNFFFSMGDLSGHYNWKGYTLGGGFYVPNGQFIGVKDTLLDPSSGQVIRMDFFNLFLLGVGNISLAREIYPGVLVGTGVDLIIGDFTLKAKKYLVNSPIQDYKFGLDAKARGYGLEGVFGLLLKPTDWLSIGTVYRTGANINVNGHLHILQTPVPAIPAGFDAASDYKQDFPLPPTWGMGIALNPHPRLTIAFDVQGTDWTVMKTEIDYENQRRGGFPLPNINKKLHWDVAWRYRGGVEYKLNPRWAFLAGYWYEPNTMPDKASSLTSANGLTLHQISWGTEYERGRWSMSAFGATHWYYENVEGKSLGGLDFMWGMGLKYHF